MKKNKITVSAVFIILSLFLLVFSFCQNQSTDFNVNETINTSEGELEYDSLIVKFAGEDVQDVEINDEVETDLTRFGEIDFSSINANFVMVDIQNALEQGASPQEIINYYNSLSYIEYVEPDYKVNIMVSPEDVEEGTKKNFEKPNDEYYKYQWNMHKLNIEDVWEYTMGSENIRVAVIDTGIAYDLTDLEDTNVDVESGYDFVNMDKDAYDDHGHGTHVSGTIAQATNNTEGVVGIAPGITLIPVKALAADGSGLTSNVASGVRWAADQGADVINMSFGGGSYTQTMYNALKYAYDKGAVIVASSGNNNGGVNYPAKYEEFVLAVGSTDFINNRAWYSNYGPELDVVAPGGDTRVDRNGDGKKDGILQQVINERGTKEGIYSFFQGTSMAAPHVAGMAAILLSYNSLLSNFEIYEIIRHSADDLGRNGVDDYYGYGLINILAALEGIPLEEKPDPDRPVVYNGFVNSVMKPYENFEINTDILKIARLEVVSDIDVDLDLILIGRDNKIVQVSEGNGVDEILQISPGSYTLRVLIYELEKNQDEYIDFKLILE